VLAGYLWRIRGHNGTFERLRLDIKTDNRRH
jgi:hypothetical protein